MDRKVNTLDLIIEKANYSKSRTEDSAPYDSSCLWNNEFSGNLLYYQAQSNNPVGNESIVEHPPSYQNEPLSNRWEPWALLENDATQPR